MGGSGKPTDNAVAKLDEHEVGQREMHILRQSHVIEHSGPLPPAEELRRYEQIAPGFALEILEMAKRAQQHAHEVDRSMVQNQNEFAKQHLKYFGRGQLVGGILALAGIIGGSVAACLGHGYAGAALVGAVMTPLMIAFGWGKWMERSQGKQSQEEAQ